MGKKRNSANETEAMRRPARRLTAADLRLCTLAADAIVAIAVWRMAEAKGRRQKRAERS